MTMFDVDTVNVEKKLQEIEDNDLYNFMKKQGYSEEQPLKVRQVSCHQSY